MLVRYRSLRLGAVFSAIVGITGAYGFEAVAQSSSPASSSQTRSAPQASQSSTPAAPPKAPTASTPSKTPPATVVAKEPVTTKNSTSATATKTQPAVALPKVQTNGALPKTTAPKSPPTSVVPKPSAPPVVTVQAAPSVAKPAAENKAENTAENTKEPEPSPASTQSSTEQAKLVYDQAVAAYEEHRYRDAIDLFQQADALRPNPAFSFNIGTAYEDMGDSAMALLHYRAYLRQLPKAFDRQDVEDRIRRLEGVLADKGLQQVTIISSPAEAMVILDGKPRGVSPWTGEIAPGAHVVTLSLEGYTDETRDFDLPLRRSIDVPVTLKKPEPKPAVPALEPDKQPEVEPKASWEYVRPVTWGVLGVSIASFGTALGFELSRSALEERSQQADSEVGRLKLHQDAERSEMWAKSFLMFAIGMGATSVVLGYQNIDDGLQAEKERTERVSFGCVSFRECAVSYSGSF